MMYNTDVPPQRRIYANGYYSEWFPIKSGVARMSLSPLLFLIVGQPSTENISSRTYVALHVRVLESTEPYP